LFEETRAGGRRDLSIEDHSTRQSKRRGSMGAEAATSSSLAFEPMANDFGAMIAGLDLGAVDELAAARLDEALHRHGVLFYRRGADITEEEFIALGAAMGEILVYPYRRDDYTEADQRLNFVDMDAGTTTELRTAAWHTDGTPEPLPPQSAMLNPVILPAAGGDTMWASMYAAYEALSPHYQRLLDGLDALHTTDAVLRKMGPRADPAMFGKGASHVHPAVLTDPVTGRRLLYVNANYTERLIGLTDRESASLLAMLFELIDTPEFHLRWQWRLGDIAIWEERVTQHKAVPDYVGRRVMRRIAWKGAPPA
jgi:taurine dioxygenase